MSKDPSFDWSDEARRALRWTCHGEMMTFHRGAAHWEHAGVTVVFGNDGYVNNQRSRDDVVRVRGYLATMGIDELGFALGEDGYSWAMLVHSDDDEKLDDVVSNFVQPITELQEDIGQPMIDQPDPKIRIFPN